MMNLFMHLHYPVNSNTIEYFCQTIYFQNNCCPFFDQIQYQIFLMRLIIAFITICIGQLPMSLIKKEQFQSNLNVVKLTRAERNLSSLSPNSSTAHILTTRPGIHVSFSCYKWIITSKKHWLKN